MHGNHFLRNEYEISSSRIGRPKESTESFKFPHSKNKGESSPLSYKLGLRRIVCTALVTGSFIVFGLIRSIGIEKIINAVSVSHIMIAYITPKLLIAKRELSTIQNSVPEKQRILEILPRPLNLVIDLNNFNEAEKKFGKDPTAHIINPLNSSSVHRPNCTLTIFESISFSWCESYLKYKQYPTKLTIFAPSKIESCIMKQYRWSMKFPKKLVKFYNSSINPFNLTCPADNKDPFDCQTSKSRRALRLKYSKLCPELAPILLACSSGFTLDRALSHNPTWHRHRKHRD